MKTLKRYLPIIFVTTLLGCQSIQANIPTPIYTTSGDYTHPESGMVFPESIGAFHRVQITQYTPKEKDVGVGYNINNHSFPISATVYIYPAPGIISIGSPPDVIEGARKHLFRNHFDVVKNDIMACHIDAKLISDNDCTITMGKHYRNGRKATFELAYTFGTQRQDSISELYLFQNGKWFIKYRFTFPKTAKTESETAIADFFNKLDWPTKKSS